MTKEIPQTSVKEADLSEQVGISRKQLPNDYFICGKDNEYFNSKTTHFCLGAFPSDFIQILNLPTIFSTISLFLHF